MDTFKIIQITDTHLIDHPDELFHGLNTRQSFQDTLDKALNTYPDTDALLLTGDISQTGNSASYQTFQSIIRNCPLPIYAIPGNHDHPRLLQHAVPNSPIDDIEVIELETLNIILLSSFVEEGKNHGELSEKMLSQLDSYLKQATTKHNIVVIHHPPVLTNSRWLDELGLVNRDELMRCLRNYYNPITVICGHVHQEINQHIDNVHVIATPSTGYQFVESSDTMRRYESPDPAYRYLEFNIKGLCNTAVHYINRDHQRLAS